MAERQDTAPPGRRPRGRPRGWDDNPAQNIVKSLDRAIVVLEHLSARGGATLTELAQETAQSPATLYRVLTTFEARGLVDFDPAAQTWHIGAGAFHIGARFLRRTALVERARPVLRALMQDTGETANLGIARDGQVLFVSQVETHQNIRAFFPPGTLSPMHASGIGKALLAHLPEAERRRIVTREGLTRFTDTTLTDPDRLDDALATIRQRGFAIDNEERNPGMRCVAAPVFDLHGEAVAGLSISGPSARLPEPDLAGIGRRVARAAADLSTGLGGLPPVSSSW